jgi:serine/threonine protein kinase
MSLEEYLKERKDNLSIEEIKEVLLELNKSLKEMKEKNILHRDLKPSNILLSLNKYKINKKSFKISDFGLS